MGGNAAHQQVGQPFRRDLVDGVENDPLSVSVDQVLVDPGLGLFGQLIRPQLAGREHHRARPVLQRVARHVHVPEFIVGADLLQLAVGVLQGLPVPETDVSQRILVGFQLFPREVGITGKGSFLDLVQVIRLPGKSDAALDVRPFPGEFVGIDDQSLGQGRGDIQHDKGGDQPDGQRRPDSPDLAQVEVGEHQHRGDHQDDRQRVVGRQPDVYVGIARAVQGAVHRVEHLVPLQVIAPGSESEKGGRQQREMDQGARLELYFTALDLAANVNGGRSRQRQPGQPQAPGCQELQQGPLENVETDILSENRISDAKGARVRVTEHRLPLAAHGQAGHQCDKDDANPACGDGLPAQVDARFIHLLGQWNLAVGQPDGGQQVAAQPDQAEQQAGGRKPPLSHEPGAKDRLVSYAIKPEPFGTKAKECGTEYR